jgi:membrane-associated phospholipid phosphatase
MLIISTVYLRYHYVADLIGGALFMILTVWSGKRLYVWWEEKRKRFAAEDGVREDRVNR